MVSSAFWHSFKRSLIRGAIALAVFLAVGVIQIVTRPDLTASDPLPWLPLAAATIATLLSWKVVLRWSFYPEDEPSLFAKPSSTGDVQMFSASFGEYAALGQAAATVGVTLLVWSGTPPPKSPCINPPPDLSASRDLNTFRFRLP